MVQAKPFALLKIKPQPSRLWWPRSRKPRCPNRIGIPTGAPEERSGGTCGSFRVLTYPSLFPPSIAGCPTPRFPVEGSLNFLRLSLQRAAHAVLPELRTGNSGHLARFSRDVGY